MSSQSEKDKEQLNQTLAEFLSDANDNKIRGYTMGALFAQMNEYKKGQVKLTQTMSEFREELNEVKESTEGAHERLDGHRAVIVADRRKLRSHLKANKSDSEFSDDEMDTGQFDMVAIEREVREQKAKRLNSERVRAENQTWLKRHIITIVLAGIGTSFAALLSILITLAVQGAKQQLQPPAPPPIVNQK